MVFLFTIDIARTIDVTRIRFGAEVASTVSIATALEMDFTTDFAKQMFACLQLLRLS